MLTVGRAPAGWTVAYAESLPVTGYRYEVCDGALSLSPPPPSWADRLAERLVKVFEAGLWPALAGAGIAFGPRTGVVADVLAFLSPPVAGRLFHRPASVAAVVRIGAVDPDPHLLRYARAGIAEFWRVDPDPVDRAAATVTVHRLAARPEGPVYLVERVRGLADLERDGVGA